jgi:enterochelin esterase-like enzyme
VHQLVSAGRIAPLIVVGVDDAGAEARAHEYLPWPDTLAHSSENNPQGKRYPDFMIREVMPFINARYRTLTDAAAYLPRSGYERGRCADVRCDQPRSTRQ